MTHTLRRSISSLPPFLPSFPPSFSPFLLLTWANSFFRRKFQPLKLVDAKRFEGVLDEGDLREGGREGGKEGEEEGGKKDRKEGGVYD